MSLFYVLPLRQGRVPEVNINSTGEVMVITTIFTSLLDALFHNRIDF
jgi:hypothetical protein